jgi:hypothetical protein
MIAPVQMIRLLPIGSLLCVILIMNFTDPTKSVASILLVFLLLYVFFASTFFVLLHEVLHHVKLKRSIIGPSKMSHTRAYYIASALAFVPVSLLAMQSLQQIRVFDVVLVAVLTLLIIFYIIKRTS